MSDVRNIKNPTCTSNQLQMGFSPIIANKRHHSLLQSTPPHPASSNSGRPHSRKVLCNRRDAGTDMFAAFLMRLAAVAGAASLAVEAILPLFIHAGIRDQMSTASHAASSTASAIRLTSLASPITWISGTFPSSSSASVFTDENPAAVMTMS